MPKIYKTCLIVDDDHLTVELMRMLVEQIGVEVKGVAYDGRSAVDAASKLDPDVVFMDVRLGEGIDGVEAAVEIMMESPRKIVFVTSHGDAATVERMKAANPVGMLTKPVDASEIERALSI